ncbi:MAG: hypothetical protein LQ343_006153 [Gyalolechia ehrenbergii]|nr:MAG: hypothetical protein LQ343_006153 [Gyalolechia ehrenbergii]
MAAHPHLRQKRDQEEYTPMFALYLDIQKHLVLEEMDEREVRGRWKRFVGRWDEKWRLTLVRNRGELAEGWYDAETLRKAQVSAADIHDDQIPPYPSDLGREVSARDGNSDDEEDDGFGPALPSNSYAPPETARRGKQSGPSIPNFQDLQEQRELTHESSLRDRSTLRQARKSDLRLQNQQLEDLAPRALPGTKDRQLERKADVRASNNSFANSKFDNAFAEMAEADLMGEEGLDGFKKKKAEEERKKNDREVRREEILRARREEREERVKAYREKEERTMEGLVALARARFG